MTRPFRAQLVLMTIGRWGFGNYVDDPQAFVLRVENWFRTNDALNLTQDVVL